MMSSTRFHRNVCFFALVVVAVMSISCSSGPQAVAHESWTLVQLLTQGERIDSESEVVDVRNCGSEEQKSIECSAGTSNNFSVNLGGSSGWSLGVDLTLEASVSDGLGFERSSGQSLKLESPPAGYVNRFVVSKEYRIVSGQVRARSSSNQERDGMYVFQASCTLRIESMETLPCEEADSTGPTLSEVEGSPTPAAEPSPVPATPTATTVPQPTQDLSGRVIPSPTPTPPPTVGLPLLQETGRFYLDTGLEGRSIAVDAKGDLYIGGVSSGSNRKDGIHKYAPDGTSLGYIASFLPGLVEDHPVGVHGVAVDTSENIYAVFGWGGGGVGVWRSDGTFLRRIPIPSGAMVLPGEIIVDAGGNLFLFDSSYVTLLDPDGGLLGEWKSDRSQNNPVLTPNDQVCWATRGGRWQLRCMSRNVAPHEVVSDKFYPEDLFVAFGKLWGAGYESEKMYVYDLDGALYHETELGVQLGKFQDVVSDGQNLYVLYRDSVRVYRLNLP